MRKKVWLSVFVAQFIIFGAWCQSNNRAEWVDSVLHQMDVPQKIGQLIMIQVSAEDEPHRLKDAQHIIEEYQIGGVVITGGGPISVSKLTRQLNERSNLPLLFSINAEEGLGSTIDSTMLLPPAIMMGAMRRDSMMYFVGQEVGRQLRTLGLHMNFGPSIDLSRSFQLDDLINHTYGDNKERVAAKSVLYMKGLHDAGIIPIAKYYSNSSIKVTGFKNGNPVVKNEDDPDKLYAIRKIAEADCPGMLYASRQTPIFPNRRNRLLGKTRKISSSVPELYTANYLKQTIGFKGLVFSYVPDVRPALRKKFRNGDAEVSAFKAGNDILISPRNTRAAIRKLRRAINRDKDLEKRLDQTVVKILSIKYDDRLPRPSTSNEALHANLNTLRSSLLLEDIYQQSIVVAKDNASALPIRILENKKFACLSIGKNSDNPFSQYLSKYIQFDRYELLDETDTNDLTERLKGYDVVIVGIFPGTTNMEQAFVPVLQTLDEDTQLISVLFDSPSRTSKFDRLSTLVEAFVDDPSVLRLVPQIIFGALSSTGIMPLTVNENINENTTANTLANGRLGYASPAYVGMDENILKKVDAIAQEAIAIRATPGCQVIIARKGKVIYEKSFGWQTYDKQQPVTSETIYDLASVTKVAATLQGTMFLYEKGLIDVNKKISYYLPELANSNKKDIIIKDILTHQAGLWPFVPFWMQTKKDSVFMSEFYNKSKSEKFPFQVAPHLYAIKSMRDSIWTWIVKSRMRDKAPRTPYNYTYSDIGLYLMFRLNEKLFNQSQDEFLSQNLYEPLGASTMGYLPLSRFDPKQIAPTEDDIQFRRELLIGTVHDEGAAMNGGVAGHAGLFGTASDLTKLGQMMLQGGYYGGIQYYRPETVKLFSSQQFETSRRGLGWDRPVISDWNNPASIYASPKTFGHTGFTGTCIWVDPEFDLVYVFLSNRVHPTRNGNKLSSQNIRSRIQDTIYMSIFEYCQFENPKTWITSK